MLSSHEFGGHDMKVLVPLDISRETPNRKEGIGHCELIELKCFPELYKTFYLQGHPCSHTLISGPWRYWARSLSCGRDYNVTINPETEDRPTDTLPSSEAVFTLFYCKVLLSLKSEIRVIHYTIGHCGLFMLIPITE